MHGTKKFRRKKKKKKKYFIMDQKDSSDEILLEEKLLRIRSQGNSKLENQKNLALVLNAVEENIDDQTSARNPVSYFVSFMSLLDQCADVESSQLKDAGLATSATYFLDIIFPFTPAPLLRSKFPEIITRLAPALNESNDAPLLRSAIGSLESLLKAQDYASWNNIPNFSISPKRGLLALLQLSMDARPKVRKRAQDGIHAVLSTTLPGPSLKHPGSATAADFALKSLSEVVQQKTKSGSNSQLIHNLSLVKSISSCNQWPSSSLQTLCDMLLDVSKTSDQFVVQAAFSCFEGLLDSLSADLNEGKFSALLEAIFAIRPSINDSNLVSAWMTVVAKSVSVYIKVSPVDGMIKLPAQFSIVADYLKSKVDVIYNAAANCLVAVVDALVVDESIDTALINNTIAQLSKQLSVLLSLGYNHCIGPIMVLLSHTILKFEQRSSPFIPCLKVVGEWRSDERFEMKQESDDVIGAAIKVLGPEVVLSFLPLNLDQTAEPGRAWLLPLLRDNIANANLSLFQTEFVPIAEKFQQRIASSEAETMHAKIYSTIVEQIWSLLPNFCVRPRDLISSFNDDFAALLANLLYEKVELRVVICHALRNLVESNIESKGADLEHLSAMADKLLQVLFNVFSSTAPEGRGYILETINSYLQIIPTPALEETFNKVCNLLKQALDQDASGPAKNQAGSPRLSVTMMDLIVAMSKYVPVSCGATLMTIFNQTVDIKDSLIQKRSYRIISSMIELEEGRQSVLQYLPDIERVIIEHSNVTSPSSKAARLSLILQIIPLLPADQLYFIPSALSEIIISTKDVNEKSRTIAYQVLIAMALRMSQGGIVENSKVPSMDSDMPSSEASLREFFTMTSAGLVGATPHMVSATITAISCLFYEFHSQMERDLLLEVSETVELFLTSNNREIAKSAIGFVKVAILCLPLDVVQANLGNLLTHLMRWSNEHKGHFKSKVKHIVERLIRKFGFDLVEQNFPREDLKLLANIKKVNNRSKRKLNEEIERTAPKKNQFSSAYEEALYASSESEGEDDDNEQEGKMPSQFITESNDVPLDLLDKQAFSQISSAKPKAAHSKKSQSKKFATKNGKLVFNEEGNIQQQADSLGSGESGLNAYVEAIKSGPVRGQRNKLKYKRGKHGDEFDDNNENEGDAPSWKRKAGGRNKVSKPGRKFKAGKKF